MYSMNSSYLLYPQNYQTIAQSQYPFAFRGSNFKPQLETPVQPNGINQTTLLTAQSVPSFQGAANAIKTLPNDTVEINGKKKSGMSTGAKVGLGILGTVAGLCIAGVAISRHQTSKLEKLYKEKLVPKIFDKEIQFTDAKTKDEAIKYAKEVLGVGTIDDKMSLDMLNYANHGITDVVNKNIGQEVFIPRSYFCFKGQGDIDNVEAYVVKSIKSKEFGQLGINEKTFSHEFLNEQLNKWFGLGKYAPKQTISEFKQAKQRHGNNCKFDFCQVVDDDIIILSNKYEKAPDSLTIQEKIKLYKNAVDYSVKYEAFDFESFIRDNKLKINLEEFSQLTFDEKLNALNKYCVENNTNITANIVCEFDKNMETIHHELGHLQDYAKNLKNLHLKDKKITELDNRFGGTTYTGFAELLEKNPEKFQKLYPDLYEHLTNKEIQKTAGKVSAYAKTSIGEFIAETYAK